MTSVKHAAKLFRELAAYAIINRAWWLIPIVAVLFVATLVVVVVEVVAPFTLYTLF